MVAKLADQNTNTVVADQYAPASFLIGMSRSSNHRDNNNGTNNAIYIGVQKDQIECISDDMLLYKELDALRALLYCAGTY